MDFLVRVRLLVSQATLSRKKEPSGNGPPIPAVPFVWRVGEGSNFSAPTWSCLLVTSIQKLINGELPARMRNQNSRHSLGIQVGNQPLPAGLSLNV
jgi:hypothetical protein